MALLPVLRMHLCVRIRFNNGHRDNIRRPPCHHLLSPLINWQFFVWASILVWVRLHAGAGERAAALWEPVGDLWEEILHGSCDCAVHFGQLALCIGSERGMADWLKSCEFFRWFCVE